MEDGGDLVRRTGGGLPGEGMAELWPDRWPRAGSKVEWEKLMGTQDQEGIPRTEKGIWKGPGARGHVTHLRTWGKASGAGLNHSMSLTLESCGLYPSCSHWEIVSRAATGWELGLKDCSSVWAGKRPRGWGEMWTPSDSAGGGFSNMIGRKEQGPNLVIKILSELLSTQPGDGRWCPREWGSCAL